VIEFTDKEIFQHAAPHASGPCGSARIICDLINDARQSAINISILQPEGPMHLRANIRGLP
jgi:hypothetical protein